MDDLYLEIISPEDVLFEGSVGLVDVPGAGGRFVLLRDHGSVISTLGKGDVRVIGKDGYEHHFKCKEGVLECHDNRAIILMNHPVDEVKADL
jgi:F-type H+-transporting ATPase subunit epsilon